MNLAIFSAQGVALVRMKRIASFSAEIVMDGKQNIEVLIATPEKCVAKAKGNH